MPLKSAIYAKACALGQNKKGAGQVTGLRLQTTAIRYKHGKQQVIRRMQKVAIHFTQKKDYEVGGSPYHPPHVPPELESLLPAAAITPRNHVYYAVREVLHLLELDRENFGSPDWDPLSELVQEGDTVLIKPNLRRHFNANSKSSLESLVTHGSVLRPLIDYVLKALRFKGRVIIADCPESDCDIEAVKSAMGITGLQEFYRGAFRFKVEFIDFRREWLVMKNGALVQRKKLSGDPAGYTKIDLSQLSEFADIADLADRLRGQDRAVACLKHHNGQRNEYMMPNSVLGADVLISVPKIGTHSKAGVALSLENMMGICADRNWLPRYRAGSPDERGDEFPPSMHARYSRRRVLQSATSYLKQKNLVSLFPPARKSNHTGEIGGGDWHGNDTIWRAIIDLGKVVFFADHRGRLHNRMCHGKYLTLLDGIVAGEGEGPLAVDDKAVGALCGGLDPRITDIAVTKLLGFDWKQIPQFKNFTRIKHLKFSEFLGENKIRLLISRGSDRVQKMPLSELKINLHFKPPSGWKAHIELPRMLREIVSSRR
jgi:uncharacterized protein (DUF362 family)